MRNSLLLALALAAIAAVTKPSNDSFKRVLKKHFQRNITSEGGGSGFNVVDSAVASGVAWIFRQASQFLYQDYTLFAVQNIQTESGEWKLTAIGIFGLWIFQKLNSSDIVIEKAD